MVRDKIVKKDTMFGVKTTTKASEAYKELDSLWERRKVYMDVISACEDLVELDDYFEETKLAGQLWAACKKEVSSIDERANEYCDMLLDNGFDPAINPLEEDC